MIIKIFLAFTVFTFIFSRFIRKYSNPYKLNYIIGLKGAGKTTYMVRGMLRALKQGHYVYTNIPHVNIPGVRIFDSKNLSNFVPPADSVLFIDEAGLVWDNRKFASFSDGLTAFFAYQRQYRLTVYMNSQALDVDKKIRDRIDNLYVISNICDCIGVLRRVKIKITAYPGTSQAEGHIGTDYILCGLSGLQLYWMPKYRRYFKSFCPPPRNYIPFSTVPLTQACVPVIRRFRRVLYRIFVLHNKSVYGPLLAPARVPDSP